MASIERRVVKLLLEWHEKNRRTFPWRIDRNPYRVLVAELLLQRTPADRVASFYPMFIQEFPTPRKLASANPFELANLAHNLGLKKRMLWLVQSMKDICQTRNGNIPDSYEELRKLPGVGEYTASAVLCFGFGRRSMIIDANVIRVLSRIFRLKENRRIISRAIRDKASKILPYGDTARHNEALLDFAALVCKRRPLCNECPIAYLCGYSKS